MINNRRGGKLGNISRKRKQKEMKKASLTVYTNDTV